MCWARKLVLYVASESNRSRSGRVCKDAATEKGTFCCCRPNLRPAALSQANIKALLNFPRNVQLERASKQTSFHADLFSRTTVEWTLFTSSPSAPFQP